MSKIIFVVILLVTICRVSAQTNIRNFQLNSIFTYNENILMKGQLKERSEHSLSGNFEKLDVSINSWITNSPIPNIYNRDVIQLFAYMSNDAYYHYDSFKWINVTGWTDKNNTYPFGWDGANLRGYVFNDPSFNETVIAFKGTDIIGNSSASDKFEDWFMFSCCGESAPTVVGKPYTGCGCVTKNVNKTGLNTCNFDCLQQCASNIKNSYFTIAIQIFEIVKNTFSGDFYFTGHSLGGAIAQMLSVKESYPAVTFEAPPTRRHAWVSNLDVSETVNPNLPIFGFGAYNDPIYVGGDNCEPCRLVGIPIKTKCQIGYICMWDIPRDPSFGRPLQTRHAHSINTIIDYVNTMDIPACHTQQKCWDCDNYIITEF